MAYDSHDSYRPRSPALNRFIQTSPARVPSPALRLQSGLYVSHASSYSAGQRYQDGLFGVGSDPSGGVVYAPQPQPSRLSSAYDYPQKPRAQYGMTRPYNSPPIGSAQGWGAGVGHFEVSLFVSGLVCKWSAVGPALRLKTDRPPVLTALFALFSSTQRKRKRTNRMNWTMMSTTWMSTVVDGRSGRGRLPTCAASVA